MWVCPSLQALDFVGGRDKNVGSLFKDFKHFCLYRSEIGEVSCLVFQVERVVHIFKCFLKNCELIFDGFRSRRWVPIFIFHIDMWNVTHIIVGTYLFKMVFSSY